MNLFDLLVQHHYEQSWLSNNGDKSVEVTQEILLDIMTINYIKAKPRQVEVRNSY